jgi:hypothetical protein
MSEEKKYKVWGYPAKTDANWHHNGRFIGSADEIEEARKLKENATLAGWGTILILDGDLVVE